VPRPQAQDRAPARATTLTNGKTGPAAERDLEQAVKCRLDWGGVGYEGSENHNRGGHGRNTKAWVHSRQKSKRRNRARKDGNRRGSVTGGKSVEMMPP
jgi:hypothetical protein